jgi:exodeoxyribonuclease VII large subunit
VRVQGDGSAEQIAAAIRGFNALPMGGRIPRPDLLIVARGGGSLEDLWSFNEEIVVRAAADSMIPLISAVGHETDTTLIDFASDRRAPTPTAAAEMAVPVRSELMLDVESLARRARATWRRNQEARRSELRSAARALPGADEVLALPRQRLDHAAAALARALRTNAQIHRVSYSRIGGRLSPHLLRGGVERRRERIGAYAKRAERAMVNFIAARRARFERDGQLLAAFSYRGVLARGFALVRDGAGQPLRTATAVAAGMPLEIEFSDGRVGARADGAVPSDKSEADPGKPRPRRGSGPGQGSLF